MNYSLINKSLYGRKINLLGFRSSITLTTLVDLHSFYSHFPIVYAGQRSDYPQAPNWIPIMPNFCREQPRYSLNAKQERKVKFETRETRCLSMIAHADKATKAIVEHEQPEILLRKKAQIAEMLVLNVSWAVILKMNCSKWR